MSAFALTIAATTVVMVAGALGTALATDVTRLVIGLGAFLLGVALTFLVLGSPLLAVAEVFLYVGGVLVLVLFALMLSARSRDERPRLEIRHDVGAAVVSVLVFAGLTWALAPATEQVGAVATEPAAVADLLLGPGLPVFELVGAVLLLALLAVLVIVKGGEE